MNRHPCEGGEQIKIFFCGSRLKYAGMTMSADEYIRRI